MRAVGIDPGERWVGVAVAEADTRLALPVATVDRRASADDGVAAILAAIGPAVVDLLVVGVPVTASGVETPQASTLKAYGFRVAKALGAPAVTQDEAYSDPVYELPEEQAPRRRGSGGRPRDHRERRIRRHAQAAAAILQRWLDTHQDARTGIL